MAPKKKIEKVNEKQASEEDEDEGLFIPTKIKNKPWNTIDRFVEVLALVTNTVKNPIFSDPSSSSSIIKWHQNLRKAHTSSNNFKFPTESGILKKMDLPNKSQASPDNRKIAQIFFDYINLNKEDIEKDLKSELDEANKQASVISKNHSEHINKELEIENKDFGGKCNESGDEDEQEVSTPTIIRSVYETTQEELIEDFQKHFDKVNEAEKKLELKKRKSEVVSPFYNKKFKSIEEKALETKESLAKQQAEEENLIQLEADDDLVKSILEPKIVPKVYQKFDNNVSIEAALKQAKILRRKLLENLSLDEDELDSNFPNSMPYFKQIKEIYQFHYTRVEELSKGLIEEKAQFLAKLEEKKSKYLEEWNRRFAEQQTNGASENYVNLKTVYESLEKVYAKKKETIEERSKQIEEDDDEKVNRILQA